jgi:hypothetical protein
MPCFFGEGIPNEIPDNPVLGIFLAPSPALQRSNLSDVELMTATAPVYRHSGEYGWGLSWECVIYAAKATDTADARA